MAERGSSYLGIRLGAGDQLSANLRLDVAAMQQSFFVCPLTGEGRPLTNDAAEVLTPKRGWLW